MIPQEEFDSWTKLIYSLCGVMLENNQGYLVASRLGPLAREAGVGSLTDLYYRVSSDRNSPLRQKVIDAITTNETSFFRDSSPFELLQHKILPDLIDSRTRTAGASKYIPLRIWSAACSTGQEVYSIAMLIREMLPSDGRFDVRITGTDISDRAVAKASYGRYTQMEMDRGMPPSRLMKYFVNEGQTWKAKDEIRSMATFRKMNLLEPFAFTSPFDIVLCRNVAIYFTEPDRKGLFQSIGRVLASDGALVIGSAESITGLCPEYEVKRYLRSAFYQLKHH
jgi:chemotaxis protein methyltransferase CheR